MKKKIVASFENQKIFPAHNPISFRYGRYTKKRKKNLKCNKFTLLKKKLRRAHFIHIIEWIPKKKQI